MTFEAAELAHTSYGLKQSFASRKFGYSRHSANEFALCSRLHKLLIKQASSQDKKQVNLFYSPFDLRCFSPISKSHWRSLPKSLMRINEAMNLSMKQWGL